MTITRYTLGTSCASGAGIPGIVESMRGEYVRHADYLESLHEAHRQIAALSEDYADMAAKNAELDRQGRGEAVGWLLKTGHGTKFAENKPKCEVDYWKPVFLHPQPAAPAVKESLTVAEPVKDESEDFEDAIDAVSKAMSRAWQLGQTYWRQADSESWSQNKKSDATQEKFNALVDETRALLARYGSKS